MVKKNILMLSILLVHNSFAITDRMAALLTTTSGATGFYLGVLMNHYNTKYKLIRPAITSSVMTFFGYAFFYSRTPASRLKKIKNNLDQIEFHSLIDTPDHDLNGYVDYILYQYVRRQYPLVDAFEQLSMLEDQLYDLQNLAEDAIFDCIKQVETYNALLNERERIASLIVKIKNRLYKLKIDARYLIQDEQLYQRNLQKQQLNLMQQGANAATMNAQAQQVQAQAAVINSHLNSVQRVDQYKVSTN